MKPHKHAELIKAWADGAKIQIQDSMGIWHNANSPTWSHGIDYRIKPETIKYRVALFKDEDTRWTISINFEESIRTCETSFNFVGWLTDWVEVEA